MLTTGKKAIIAYLMCCIGTLKVKGFTRKRNTIIGAGLLIAAVFTVLDWILTSYALIMKLIATIGKITFALNNKGKIINSATT